MGQHSHGYRALNHRVTAGSEWRHTEYRFLLGTGSLRPGLDRRRHQPAADFTWYTTMIWFRSAPGMHLTTINKQKRHIPISDSNPWTRLSIVSVSDKY